MASALASSIRVIGQGLSLSFGRRPRSRIELTGMGTFLTAIVLAMIAFALQDYLDVDKPADFHTDNWGGHGGYFLLLLVAAWAAMLALRRPALWLLFAALAAVFGIPWMALSIQLPMWLDQASDIQLEAWKALLAMAGFLVVWQALRFVAPEARAPRRMLAALVFVAIMAWPWAARQESWLWYPPEDESETPEAPTDTDSNSAGLQRAEAAPAFDARAVIASQPALLQRELATLRPQVSGTTELFAIGFAGDGSEQVFRNEVDYLSLLMARRFGAEHRTVALVNSPDTLDDEPLATLSNLESALKTVGSAMDRREDILLLFLTSHGSRNHQLYVGMDPLPLKQVTPENLRAALDASGIQNRIVVVSACYSGGFVDALRDAHTLVITAARADRTSFGCGADSEITWFGKAFLTEGLNETTDFEQAFAIASRQIREWELAQGETSSVPQIAVGSEIGERLRQFRASLKDSGPVAFAPSVIARSTAITPNRKTE
jgi:hypothetical protein